MNNTLKAKDSFFYNQDLHDVTSALRCIVDLLKLKQSNHFANMLEDLCQIMENYIEDDEYNSGINMFMAIKYANRIKNTEYQKKLLSIIKTNIIHQC